MFLDFSDKGIGTLVLLVNVFDLLRIADAGDAERVGRINVLPLYTCCFAPSGVLRVDG